MSNITSLLGKIDAAGQYVIEPFDARGFKAARERLLDELSIEPVAVRLRPDEHIAALDPRICGGIMAALYQLNGLDERTDPTVRRPRVIEAQGKVTVPLQVKHRSTRNGRALQPEIIKSVTIARGQVKHLPVNIAYYLVDPARWGLLFEEVDAETGEPVVVERTKRPAGDGAPTRSSGAIRSSDMP